MPLCLDAWRHALQNVDRSPGNLLPKQFQNDGKYAFPEPGLICSGNHLARQNQYLTVWEHLRPVIINRMSSDMHRVTLLSNQDWCIVLGGRQPSDKTRTGSLHICLNNLLSPDAAKAGVDLSRIHEAPVKDYSAHEAQQILWELSELSFRYELLMLDRRAIMQLAQAAEDKEFKDWLSPMSREIHVLHCFPFSPSEPHHLAYVPADHASRGLAFPAIRDRLPYLNALHRLMADWDGYTTHHVGRLHILTQDAPDIELNHYENAITRFYTQTFYRYFGHAAIVPMYLSQS